MPGRLLEPSTFRCRTKYLLFAAMIPAGIKLYPSLISVTCRLNSCLTADYILLLLAWRAPGTSRVKLRYRRTYTIKEMPLCSGSFQSCRHSVLVKPWRVVQYTRMAVKHPISNELAHILFSCKHSRVFRGGRERSRVQEPSLNCLRNKTRKLKEFAYESIPKSS